MQAFFDSSTPVPIGQDSPEVSVKAPDVSPDPSYNLPNNCPNCGSELDPYWHFDAWHCSSCSEVVLSVQLAQADASKYPVMDYPQTPMTQLKTVRTDNEAVDEVYFKGVFAGELVIISPMDSWEFRQKEKLVIFGHINNVGDFYGYPNKVIDYLQSDKRASLFENEYIEGQTETYSYYPLSEIEISSDSDTPIKVEAFLLGPNLAMHESTSGMWTLTHVPTGCYFWRSRDVIELERLAWQLVDFDLGFSSVSDAPPELVAFGKKWRAERSEVFYE